MLKLTVDKKRLADDNKYTDYRLTKGNTWSAKVTGKLGNYKRKKIGCISNRANKHGRKT